MKKILNGLAFLSLAFFMCFGLIACQQTKSENQNSNGSKVSETIELGTATLGDVEFENADTVELKNENGQYNVTGTITAMSESQIIAFGVQDVTHTIVLKVTFDKEKTISSFEIKGNTTKVYADNKETENYVGSLSELLDNEDGEDAFCYLVLSANTTEYTFKTTYSDKSESEVKLKISATLATATED